MGGGAEEATTQQSACSLQEPAEGGAEIFLERELLLRFTVSEEIFLVVELLLLLRDSEDWERDLGRSAAMAAITSMATGQNHSCSSGWWRSGRPWITTDHGQAEVILRKRETSLWSRVGGCHTFTMLVGDCGTPPDMSLLSCNRQAG